MVIREIVFADVARNWWVLATIIAAVALVLSLRRGSALRNALVNVFVGFPAGLWMIATQAGVTAGGPLPLFLSILLALGHVGAGITNFLYAALRQPVDVEKEERAEAKEKRRRGRFR